MSEILSNNLAALRRLDAAEGHDDKTDELATFVGGHLALGLELVRAPERRYEDEVEAYLAESAPVLERNRFQLATWPRGLERILGSAFEGDEWQRVVEGRSAFEFLRELYEGTEVGPALARVDLTALDARIREISAVEGHLAGEEIPPDMPPSHWWWWAPGAGPAAG